MNNNNKLTIMRTLFLVFAFLSFGLLQAQEKEEKKVSKTAYYKQRAKEDAKFEQEYKAKSKKEQRKFWKEQKAYERDLKEKDKIAYEAYMQGKRDAYAEHNEHCNHHCSHGYYYHSHARYYYTYEYRRQPRYNSSINTRVRISAPRIRIGF
jgi:hypothetical protein